MLKDKEHAFKRQHGIAAHQANLPLNRAAGHLGHDAVHTGAQFNARQVQLWNLLRQTDAGAGQSGNADNRAQDVPDKMRWHGLLHIPLVHLGALRIF